MKRRCFNCDDHIPPETDHFLIGNEEYCCLCVEVTDYVAHQYFIGGDYVGNSESGDVDFVESFDDFYDEG